MHLQRLKSSFVQEVEPECEPDLYDLPGLPVSRYCLKSPPCQALRHAVVWGHNRHHPSPRIYTQCCSGTPSGVASLGKNVKDIAIDDDFVLPPLTLLILIHIPWSPGHLVLAPI